MGSYDGAEICELVGLYLLNQMKNAFPVIDFGLYRDDGLGNYKRMPGPQAEKMRKNIIKLFKDNGLRITIVMNECIANFLDATLNLTTGKHMPYKKLNDTPLYIHKHSNHPPSIIKQIPSMIETRLSDLSSDPAALLSPHGRDDTRVTRQASRKNTNAMKLPFPSTCGSCRRKVYTQV